MTPSTIARPTNVRTSEPLPEPAVWALTPLSAGRRRGVSSPEPVAAWA